MKTTIYSSYPALVRHGESSEHISINEHITIEDVVFPVYIYPEQKTKPSFEIDFLNPSPSYRVIEKDGKYLVFLLDGLTAENVNIHTLKHDGASTTVEVGQKQIVFCGLNGKKIVKLARPITGAKIGHFYHINYALFDDNGAQSIICYNTRNNSAKIFSAKEISLDESGFSLFEENNNYKNITYHYTVDREGLKLKENSFVQSSESFPSELLCFKFMTAIKCGDYEGATGFLTEELTRDLNAQSLKGFFGNVSYFYMIDPKTCFAISDNKNVIYSFSVDDNKICEIQDNL